MTVSAGLAGRVDLQSSRRPGYK